MHIIFLMSEESILPTKKPGAVQIVAQHLAQHLAQKYKITIISAYAKDLLLYEKINEVDYLRLKIDLNWYLRLWGRKPAIYLKAAALIIRKLKPDFVHIHNRPSYILPLKRLLGSKIPLILHEHNHNLRDSFGTKKSPPYC